ncbi:hypothetical protein H5410_017542 [Solanum commersonii]|uniref:Uncharacterized protein n=1 Tax=Solanum commersonii TaxID=4109 RepID=A0A9J5ZZD4_SOLCO|nr:hypothetical protein H5410_017542 [Solanum commersonii]
MYEEEIEATGYKASSTDLALAFGSYPNFLASTGNKSSYFLRLAASIVNISSGASACCSVAARAASPVKGSSETTSSADLFFFFFFFLSIALLRLATAPPLNINRPPVTLSYGSDMDPCLRCFVLCFISATSLKGISKGLIPADFPNFTSNKVL